MRKIVPLFLLLFGFGIALTAQEKAAFAILHTQQHELQDIRVYWSPDFPEDMDSIKVVNNNGRPELELFTTDQGMDENGSPNPWIDVIATSLALEDLQEVVAENPYLSLRFKAADPTRIIELSLKVNDERRFNDITRAFKSYAVRNE